MAGMKLKNGADLCGFELRRFTIQNDSSDPTDLKVGRKYFNNGGGTAHLRERIYVGDKTITTDGWRDAAYMDDIKRLEGIIGSLDGNVGDNLLGLAEQLNAVQAKVDAFLEGDVDADAVLENLNELKQFLDTYSGDVTLSQVLNDINEEVAKKADKATTLGGYGINDAISHANGIEITNGKPYKVMGYGYSEHGWKSSGPAMSIGVSSGYLMQIQSANLDGNLYHKHVSANWEGNWYKILDDNNYASVLDSVYLKQSGGTIAGGEGALEVKRDFTDGGSYILFSNTARTLGYIGVNSSMMPAFTQDGSVYYTLLHEGNYASVLGTVYAPYNAAGYLPLSGGTMKLDSYSSLFFQRNGAGISAVGYSNNNGVLGYIGVNADSAPMFMTAAGVQNVLLHTNNFNTYAPTLTGTGASGTWGIDISGSATKLATERRLWGNPFDGTANVNGTIHLPFGKELSIAEGQIRVTNNSIIYKPDTNYGWNLGTYFYEGSTQVAGFLAKGSATANGGFYQIGMYAGSHGVILNSSGNVTIGASDKAEENYKLYVNGAIHSQVVVDHNTLGSPSKAFSIGANTAFGLDVWVKNDGSANVQAHRFDGTATAYALNLQPLGGVVNVGTNLKVGGKMAIGSSVLDAYHLYVGGDTRIDGALWTYGHIRPVADGAYYLGLLNNAWSGAAFTGNVMFGSGDEGIYINGKTLNWHTNQNAWSAELMSFAKNAISINTRLLVGGASDDGTTALQVNGAASFSSTAKVTGELILKNPTAIRWAFGDYGVLYRNDGQNFYILFTDSGQAETGSWNSLRPFRISLTTGGITMEHDLTVSGLTRLGTAASVSNRFVVFAPYEQSRGVSFGYMKSTIANQYNIGILHIGTNYGGANDITNYSVDMTAISIYRSIVGIGKEYDYASLRAIYDAGADLGVTKGVTIGSSSLLWNGSGLSLNTAMLFNGEVTINSTCRINGMTTLAGATIPTGYSLKIGEATLIWDSAAQALKVDKSFYSTEEVSAGGIGSGTTSGGGGGTNNTKAFDIPIGTESMTFAHNLGTKDVIVAIYEISDSYQQVLADVIINNISEVTIMFGEATEVAHRVVIMG